MTEYEDNKEFRTAIETMIANTTLAEFNPIRENEIVIFSLLCIRTDTNDEPVQVKGAPVICRKIPPPFQTMTGGQYLVIGDHYFWNHVDENKQKAALYHALMHIDVEVPEKGDVKYKTRKPEVQVFRSEVTRFGAHSEVLLDFREAFRQSANKLTESMKAKK